MHPKTSKLPKLEFSKSSKSGQNFLNLEFVHRIFQLKELKIWRTQIYQKVLSTDETNIEPTHVGRISEHKLQTGTTTSRPQCVNIQLTLVRDLRLLCLAQWRTYSDLSKFTVRGLPNPISPEQYHDLYKAPITLEPSQNNRAPIMRSICHKSVTYSL